ncbi:MAG: hypothetical protein NTX11_01535 [Candidatus Saccharibacteria bacterium]|nr:hypothetical protein [Candidatus Saccharibacteria bacterium]
MIYTSSRYLIVKTMLFSAFLVGIFGAVGPVKAHAISNNNYWIPNFITDQQEANSLRTCDKPNPPAQYNYAQFRWISPKDAHKTTSTTPSLDVNYGQSSIDLTVNYLSTICNANINGPYTAINPYFNGGIKVKDKRITSFTNVAGTASSTMNGAPFGILSGIDGVATNVLYADGYKYDWRYMAQIDSKPFHNDFTLSGIGTLSVGLHTIEIKVETRAVHQDSAGNFVCVDYQKPKDSGYATSLNDPKCLKTPVTMTVIINVLPKPDTKPTANISADCTNIYINNATDSDAPSQEIDFSVIYGSRVLSTGTTSNGKATYDLTDQGIPAGSSILVGLTNFNPDGAKDNGSGFPGKAGWYPVTWPPVGSVCPAYIIKHAPSVSLSPDDEQPTSATFTSTAKVVSLFGTIPKVKNVTITCTYRILKAGGAYTTPAGWTESASALDIISAGIPVCSPLSGLGIPPGTITGDQVCLKVTASPGSGIVDGAGNVSLTPRTDTFEEKCSPIVNKPYVSFYGADVRAGSYACGGARSTTGAIKTFIKGSNGSGSELAAFALSTISGFNTAKNRSNPSPVMTFANSPAPTRGSFGEYACRPDDFNTADTTNLTSNQINVSSLASGRYKKTGNVTINGGSLTLGQHIYLYVTGDVRITGSITDASGNWSSRSQIPSLYIYAKGNITIDNAVTKLYGVYTAQKNGNIGGTINTCTEATNSLGANNYNACSNQLLIDGAFVADKVNLQRTFGSLRDSAAQDSNPLSGGTVSCSGNTPSSVAPLCAAEVFMFSPSLYLADPPTITSVPGTSSGTYDYITTLPPFL